MNKPLRLLLWLGCALLIAAPPLSAQSDEDFVEPARVPQAPLSFTYIPTFGLGSGSPLPFHDKFQTSVQWLNLFPTGFNLNLSAAFEHSTGDASVLPRSGEITDQKLLLNRDSLTTTAHLTFAKFWQIQVKGRSLQSRSIRTAGEYSDYNFDLLQGRVLMTFDRRWSDLASWSPGVAPLYPQSGFLVSLGASENFGRDLATSRTSEFRTGQASVHYLLPIDSILSVSFEAEGESSLGTSLPRPYKLVSSVLGAYQLPGDYQGSARLEARFLWPQGLYWDTPEFLLINSVTMKFSPGFSVGVNSGVVGDFGQGYESLQSVSLSPLVAVRMNGSLSAVIRIDLTVARSPSSPFVVGISLGTVSEQSSPVLKYKVQ